MRYNNSPKGRKNIMENTFKVGDQVVVKKDQPDGQIPFELEACKRYTVTQVNGHAVWLDLGHPNPPYVWDWDWNRFERVSPEAVVQQTTITRTWYIAQVELQKEDRAYHVYPYQDEEGDLCTCDSMTRADGFSTPEKALRFAQNVLDQLNHDDNLDGTPVMLHALKKVVVYDLAPTESRPYTFTEEEEDAE